MGSLTTIQPAYDVLILGSGLSGLCSLHRIRNRFPEWRVKVLERASNVGGTWWYNCYPGCRVDTESLTYCFSCDKDLLNEWQWKETFSSQPDVWAYIRRFAEKNDLYKDITFGTTVSRASWDGDNRTWTLTTDDEQQFTTRFLVTCIGFLSAPALPAIPGIDTFKGAAFHTSRWPAGLDVDRDFAGKRIGVIGTGATGIQVITALSRVPRIKSLSVFQRTANWSAPLRNEPISPEQMTAHAANYDVLFSRCDSTPSGFLHMPDPRKTFNVSESERLAHWEKIYNEPGFSKWLNVFSDTYTDRQANDLYSQFIANKIRERVTDPTVAESLIPRDHGFGMRRVPLESGYFESYNQDNVNLVDLKKTPITEVVGDGIITSDGVKHELNILIYATGFDAITGAFRAIKWKGEDGRPLIEISGTPGADSAIWLDHRPYTFLGMTIPSMPNLITVMGPHQPVGNAARNAEHSAQVAADMLDYCRKNGYTYIKATEEAADAWTEHVAQCGKGSLVNEVDSWMTGVNGNVAGKTVRMVARYTGPVQEYRRRCAECRDNGYEGLVFK